MHAKPSPPSMQCRQQAGRDGILGGSIPGQWVPRKTGQESPLVCTPPRGPPREDDDPEEETPKLLCVPYVRGVSKN